MEIKRRRAHRKTGKVQTKTVHAITSLPPEQAARDNSPNCSRNHWSVEALHHVRDVTYGEHASRVRIGAAPRATATLRNLALDSCAKQAGPTSPQQPITTGHAPARNGHARLKA